MENSIDENSPLFVEGALDSVHMISFVMFVEDTFNVRFLPRDINQENFKSLRTISALVETKLSDVR